MDKAEDIQFHLWNTTYIFTAVKIQLFIFSLFFLKINIFLYFMSLYIINYYTYNIQNHQILHLRCSESIWIKWERGRENS